MGAASFATVVDVDEARFEELVAEALDGIPDDVGRHMDNVVVHIRDRAPAGDLLGLYQGIPLTDRAAYGGLAMPDRITIYRQAICRSCVDEDEVVEQVRVTVVHEVAHHFGIDDDRLDELGWG